MKAEEIIKNLNLENLPSPDAEETIWKKITLPNQPQKPDTTLQSRALFMAYMIFMPIKALWTLCFQNLFKVKPKNAHSAPPKKRREENPTSSSVAPTATASCTAREQMEEAPPSTAQTMDA
ncbi:MAG: hypothetical protein ACTSRV_03055 [Candidatus Freyarchaeota archaeon]